MSILYNPSTKLCCYFPHSVYIYDHNFPPINENSSLINTFYNYNNYNYSFYKFSNYPIISYLNHFYQFYDFYYYFYNYYYSNNVDFIFVKKMIAKFGIFDTLEIIKYL